RFFQTMKTDVVRASFHAHGLERNRSDLLKKGNVFFVELLLKCLCRGGDKHAPACDEGGDQVRESLSCSGAGLNQKDAALLKSAVHLLSHFDLTGTILVVGVMLRDQSVWTKNFFH